MSVGWLVERCEDSFALMSRARECSSAALPFDVVIDSIITDPPYNQHVQDNLCSGSLVGVKTVPKYTLPFAAVADHTWVGDALNIARRWVVTFCAVEEFGEYKRSNPLEYVRGCIWYKANSMGQLTRDRPATAYEGIGLLHRTTLKKRWNGRGSYGIWHCNGTRGLRGRHPNEKPIDLCLKLVALFSDRGETVFDPFCGRAPIGEACIRLGRNYVGLDQDREWVTKARQRLAMAEDAAPVSDEDAQALCGMPRKQAVGGTPRRAVGASK